ncbi:uridine diphosphate glucose pyrophosphatase NUDT14 [Sylvia borin]
MSAPVEAPVAAGEERRCWSAIVCALTALQGSREPQTGFLTPSQALIPAPSEGRGRRAPPPRPVPSAPGPLPARPRRLRAPLPFLLLLLPRPLPPGRHGGHRGAGGPALHLLPLPAAFPPLLPAAGHPHFSKVDATKGEWMMHQIMNGTKKYWDFMRTHDSVSILIFNTSRQCFVVVKQFRPAVYMCEVERHHPQVFQNQDKGSFPSLENPLPAAVGVTYELCAGIVDKPGLSLEEIACEEVLEECGYRVSTANLRRITSYRSGVGVTGSRQTLFYAEVNDQMRTSGGGGQPEEGELIEVVEIPLGESMKFAYDETFPKTMGVIFSFMWFHNNIAPKLPKK